MKTSPKGFDRDHEHIDMIKKKQFIFVRKLNEEDILDENFHQELTVGFSFQSDLFLIICLKFLQQI